jgi:hypothetical protein
MARARSTKAAASAQSSGRSSSKAEPDVTGVYRRVKSRKGTKKSLSNISIEKFGQQNQRANRQQKMKKVLDKETKLVYESASSKIVNSTCAARRAQLCGISYRPYAKQREFHAAGASARARLLMAGNQLGKTIAGGFEAAMHATGRYPGWWQGRRFDMIGDLSCPAGHVSPSWRARGSL